MYPESTQRNDYKLLEIHSSSQSSYAFLLEFKEIVIKQLASMKKEYVITMLFDENHYSIVLLNNEE